MGALRAKEFRHFFIPTITRTSIGLLPSRWEEFSSRFPPRQLKKQLKSCSQYKRSRIVRRKQLARNVTARIRSRKIFHGELLSL